MKPRPRLQNLEVVLRCSGEHPELTPSPLGMDFVSVHGKLTTSNSTDRAISNTEHRTELLIFLLQVFALQIPLRGREDRLEEILGHPASFLPNCAIRLLRLNEADGRAHAAIELGSAAQPLHADATSNIQHAPAVGLLIGAVVGLQCTCMADSRTSAKLV